mmetsp:Transcript_26547/g.47989  ORF Transcript_26547/g.47989 Transcript_26547/m.47989 type:complete len:179 (-) Transcript_26547:55-591(-)
MALQAAGRDGEFELDEQELLEADGNRFADEPQKPNIGRSDSFDESARLERLMELDAKHLAENQDSSEENQLRAMREADQLGHDAERGLEAELAREREGEAKHFGVSEGQETDNDLDPYAHQLESELQDHLIDLRLEERRKARGPLKDGTGAGALEEMPEPAEFSPPLQMAGEGESEGL